MKIEKLNESFSQITGTESELQNIANRLKVEEPGAFFNPLVKRGFKSPFIYFTKKFNDSLIVYNGHLRLIGHPEVLKSDFTLNEIKEYLESVIPILPFKPYDYQLRCFIESILNVKHINLLCTGSGKSLGIALLLDFFLKHNKRCLLLVPNINLLEQFKSDITSIKTIKKIIDSGGIITIAPAGQIAVHGEMPYIDKAIVKLLKFCKVDIYALQMHGNYLAYPKWHKVKRSFPLHTNFVKVMSKEDLQTLSDDDIYGNVVKYLDFCDLDEQKVNPKVIKSKDLIKGLDNILYYCPKCKSKYTLTTENNRLVCGKCPNTVRMDEYGFLRPVGDDCIMFENEAEWYKYQKELLKKEIKENKLHIEGDFLLNRNINDECTLEDVGTGKIVLTNNSFYYDGTLLDKHVLKKFNLEQLIQIPFDVAVRLTVPDDEGTFQFRPLNNPKQIMEYVQAIDAMRELRQEENK